MFELTPFAHAPAVRNSLKAIDIAVVDNLERFPNTARLRGSMFLVDLATSANVMIS